MVADEVRPTSASRSAASTAEIQGMIGSGLQEQGARAVSAMAQGAQPEPWW